MLGSPHSAQSERESGRMTIPSILLFSLLIVVHQTVGVSTATWRGEPDMFLCERDHLIPLTVPLLCAV